MRAAIEENPLGKASRKKPGKATLDTTEAETGESREELPGSTAEATENSATAEDSSAPMAAFDGSAKRVSDWMLMERWHQIRTQIRKTRN